MTANVKTNPTTPQGGTRPGFVEPSPLPVKVPMMRRSSSTRPTKLSFDDVEVKKDPKPVLSKTVSTALNQLDDAVFQRVLNVTPPPPTACAPPSSPAVASEAATQTPESFKRSLLLHKKAANTHAAASQSPQKHK